MTETSSRPERPIPYASRQASSLSFSESQLGQFYVSSRSKRMLDLFVATLALVLATPLLAIAILMILVTSRGSAIYRQERFGVGMKPFQIYKLRTMYVSPPDVPFKQAKRGDARITSVGLILRKTSIDELPQLFNVLRGEMSVVGPRPHPVSLDEKYMGKIDRYKERFTARPGITGLAQVSGARGETPTIASMERRIDFDLKYVNTATIWFDFRILGSTLLEVISSKTAC